jgi:hypothetical protein
MPGRIGLDRRSAAQRTRQICLSVESTVPVIHGLAACGYIGIGVTSIGTSTDGDGALSGAPAIGWAGNGSLTRAT